MDAMPFILIGMAMLSACFTVFAFIGGTGKRRLARRAKRLSAAGNQQRGPKAGPQLLRETNGSLDAFIHRILPRPDAVRTRLAASGTGMSIGRYGLICILVAVSAAILLTLRGVAPLGALLLGLLCGICLPHLYIGRAIASRRAKFSKLFPEAIGLIVRGLKAGLPVTETMQVVGREVGDPVGEDFRRIADQVKLGQPLEEAMWTAAKRLDLAEFNFLVITFSVQRETGGNLAETLENLEEILRKRQQMRLKVKAMSSEAKASAGIIGSLPFVMSAILYVVSHDYIMALFTSHAGHLMVGFGLTSMAAGVFIMSQMIKFEI
jgi:tight adherence protein B